jgi:formate-dependent nitrite reductase membrane component NrfD
MKKNGNPQKGIFILFLSFAIFINSCSDTILKNISQFQRKKSTHFEMLHRSPIGHAAAEREFLFAFFC